MASEDGQEHPSAWVGCNRRHTTGIVFTTVSCTWIPPLLLAVPANARKKLVLIDFVPVGDAGSSSKREACH